MNHGITDSRGLPEPKLIRSEEELAGLRDLCDRGYSLEVETTRRLLHTLGFWKMQCEAAVSEIGDLRSLTLGEMPNASFVASYREVLAERARLRAEVEQAEKNAERYRVALDRICHEDRADVAQRVAHKALDGDA